MPIVIIHPTHFMNHTKQSRATWNAFLLDWTVKHVLAISEDCYRTRLNLLLAGVVCLAADNPQMIDLMARFQAYSITLRCGTGTHIFGSKSHCKLSTVRRASNCPVVFDVRSRVELHSLFCSRLDSHRELKRTFACRAYRYHRYPSHLPIPKMLEDFGKVTFKGSTIIALVMLSLAAIFAPYASVIGTVPLFFGLLVCWLYVLSNIALIAVKRHIHIVTIIFVWGVLSTSISLFPGEHLTVVELTVAEKFEPALRAIEKGRHDLGREYGPAEFFWDQNKPDADLYPFAEHYPVFVVAAEGGAGQGMLPPSFSPLFRINAHILPITCRFFGRIGRECRSSCFCLPSKKHWRESTTNAGGKSYRSLTERFFSRDYLAPIVSAGLSGDVIQHFVPFPLFLGDRAEALERAFELGMAYTLEQIPSRDGKNPMSETLGQLYRASFWIPEVIFNTTNIETG